MPPTMRRELEQQPRCFASRERESDESGAVAMDPLAPARLALRAFGHGPNSFRPFPKGLSNTSRGPGRLGRWPSPSAVIVWS